MNKKITLQDIFDKAWRKFVVECGKPATSDGDTCLYKVTVDGEVRNCAVGLALSEEQISKIIGNPDFPALCEYYPQWFDIDRQSLNSYRLSRFQIRLHDGLIDLLGNPEYIEDIRYEYLLVAKDYNLKVPE